MNQSIKKILVPIDLSESSEAAVSIATAFALKLEAELCLLHVLIFNDYYFSIVPEVKSMLPSIKEIELAVRKRLEELSDKVRKDSGVALKSYVSTGNIEREIFDFSKREKIDLIIMGTHGASGYREQFIGSNAQKVVTLSDIPVLTVQGDWKKTEFKNVLVPIDNSLHSREKINTALMIAGLFGSKIHLLGLPDTDKKEELDKFGVKLETVERIIAEKQLSFDTVIVPGESIADAALKYVTKNSCDLIVINTGHESKTTGIFLGTFAQNVVNHSIVPVLSIRHTEGVYDINTEGFGIG